jgi:hypothetical protein
MSALPSPPTSNLGKRSKAKGNFMTSFPQLLTNRELGLPESQPEIEQALEGRIANNMIYNRFNSAIIQLQKNSYISRCQDFVAVLALDIPNSTADQIIYRLALWSLSARSKLWDMEISTNRECSAEVSKSGMVLLDLGPDRKIIALNGKQTGLLSGLDRLKIVLIENRIIGYRTEKIDDRETHYFGEWDHEGKELTRYEMNYIPGRSPEVQTCNEAFWVCLSCSDQPNLASTVEVVDRVARIVNSFRLPIIPKEQGENFTSAHIFENLLFYGKNLTVRNSNIYQSVFGICNLITGVIKEFPNNYGDYEQIKHLTANRMYAAWLEYRGTAKDQVAYMNLSNHTIVKAITIPANSRFHLLGGGVHLRLFGSVLSIIHPDDSFWRRKVIDLTTGQLKYDVRYKIPSWKPCSFDNGIMSITDQSKNSEYLYVENFLDKGFAIPSSL